jgi:drug/metabolite transporter (DMT)-like permease
MKNNIALGALLITASELSLLFTGMIIKQISNEVPLEQIIFLRNLIGLALLLPWLFNKGIKRLHTKRISMHLLRGIVGVSAMVCMFFAWGNLPLAQAALLKQTSPLFIPIIAYFWLQERIGKKTIMALFIGFIGVMMIINNGTEDNTQNTHFNFAIIVAIIGAILAGIAKVSIRKMRSTETPGRIVFYFALIGTIASVIPALLAWVELSWIQLAYLAGIALFSTIGQLLLSKAYGLAPAGQLGPYTYTSVAFAALFGWLIWGEVLLINTWIGILIIIFAGILAVRDRH